MKFHGAEGRKALPHLLGAAFLLVGLVAQSALAQEQEQPAAASSEAARADIIHLTELMGVRSVVNEMFSNFARQIGADFEEGLQANVPSEERRHEIASAIVKKIQDSMDVPAMVSSATVPFYEKNFNADEIKQLIAFYESPLGRHLAEVQLRIVPAAMDAGQQWAEEKFSPIFQNIMEEIVALYPEIRPQAPELTPMH